VPAIPQAVKDDAAFWMKSDMPCLLPYVEEAVINPTVPVYEGFNPAWGQANAEQLWGQAHADVIKGNMKVADAVDKAFKRAEQIFSKMTFG
jgi:ABC-type glycerol-3-phosphate transport system substrate-binding protein